MAGPVVRIVFATSTRVGHKTTIEVNHSLDEEVVLVRVELTWVDQLECTANNETSSSRLVWKNPLAELVTFALANDAIGKGLRLVCCASKFRR